MPEYIEREAAIRKLQSEADFAYADSRASNASGIEDAIDELKHLPAADVAPVVRCKDCRYMERVQRGRFCNVWGFFNGAGDDGFCNYGERKESADAR